MSTFRVRVTQGDSRTGGGNLDRIALLNGSITGASNASPIVVTAASHGLVTGTRITVSDVAGNTAANGDWIITVVDANSFSLNGSDGDGSYTSGGLWRVDSNQRTMFAPGPGGSHRKLRDGDEFVDCNYWKQFAYPQVPLNQAFIEVVDDDGAPYVAGQANNYVRTYNKTVTGGSSFTTSGNTIDVIGDNGSNAYWATITTDQDIVVRLNGSSTSDFTVSGNTTYSFSNGDVIIQTLQVKRTGSGSATVAIQFGLRSACRS